MFMFMFGPPISFLSLDTRNGFPTPLLSIFLESRDLGLDGFHNACVDAKRYTPLSVFLLNRFPLSLSFTHRLSSMLLSVGFPGLLCPVAGYCGGSRGSGSILLFLFYLLLISHQYAPLSSIYPFLSIFVLSCLIFFFVVQGRFIFLYIYHNPIFYSHPDLEFQLFFFCT